MYMPCSSYLGRARGCRRPFNTIPIAVDRTRKWYVTNVTPVVTANVIPDLMNGDHTKALSNPGTNLANSRTGSPSPSYKAEQEPTQPANAKREKAENCRNQ